MPRATAPNTAKLTQLNGISIHQTKNKHNPVYTITDLGQKNECKILIFEGSLIHLVIPLLQGKVIPL
jgi:hypothetical protein